MAANRAKRHTISNGPAKVVFSPAKGRFDVVLKDSLSSGLKDVTAGVVFAHGETVTLAGCTLLSVSREGGLLEAVYRLKGGELGLTVSKAPRNGAFEISVAWTNRSRKDVPVAALLPVCSDAASRLETGYKDSSIRIYRNSSLGDGHSSVVKLSESHMENSGDDALWGDELVRVRGLVRSAMMTQVRGKGFYLTAGFLSAKRQDGILSVAARPGKKRPAFSASGIADLKLIAPGRRYHSEPLYLSLSGESGRALSDYASLCGEQMSARRFAEQPSIWCSCRSRGGSREAGCRRNLKWLAANRDRAQVNTFLVDKGWQSDVGDWLDLSTSFPRGIEALAGDVREAGLTPGIWLAPFVVSETSKVFAEHPGWVVKDDNGNPLVVSRLGRRALYALDITDAHVLGYIAHFTGRIALDWGYGLLAIDLIGLAAVRGVRRDNTKTRAEILRRGLEVIRQNVGLETYLLTLAAPFGSTIGIADGDGASTDAVCCSLPVEPQRSLSRLWAHGLLFHNDSGCLDLGSRTANSAEMQTQINAALLSGGLVSLSAELRNLPPRSIALLAKMFPPPTTPAVALDLYGDSPPSLYFAAGDSILLGVFNWGEKERVFRVNPRRVLQGIPATRWRDFWKSRKEPIPSGSVEVKLSPGQSRLFLFT